mmetsp:Transcript_13091/g.34287  ORF Transcript_13091/g.34287 Transcript_13091/m.34287 type:complete len:259 (-) Transcript_13091:1733-2509(-)
MLVSSSAAAIGGQGISRATFGMPISAACCSSSNLAFARCRRSILRRWHSACNHLSCTLRTLADASCSCTSCNSFRTSRRSCTLRRCFCKMSFKLVTHELRAASSRLKLCWISRLVCSISASPTSGAISCSIACIAADDRSCNCKSCRPSRTPVNSASDMVSSSPSPSSSPSSSSPGPSLTDGARSLRLRSSARSFCVVRRCSRFSISSACSKSPRGVDKFSSSCSTCLTRDRAGWSLGKRLARSCTRASSSSSWNVGL